MRINNWVLILLFTLAPAAWGQSSSISLNPTSIVPNIISITAVRAGQLPEDPMSGNSSQTLNYQWIQQWWYWGSESQGRVEVNCWWVPGGFAIYSKADSNSGSGNKNGRAAGNVLVTSDYKDLIYGIRSTSLIARVLTQSVVVTDFSQLSIGQYSVTINYRLSY